MFNTSRTLLKAIVLISILVHSTVSAHETGNLSTPFLYESKTNESKISGKQVKAFDCDNKSNNCAIAMVQNKTGKIKLANVPSALKRKKAQSSAVLPLITTMLEKEFIKDKLISWNNKSELLAELNLIDHKDFFTHTMKQLSPEDSEKYLGALRYGNKKLYSDQKAFAPESLLISPVEQVKFLKRVIENRQVTQIKTRQKIESIFKIDSDSKIYYLVFDDIHLEHSAPNKEMLGNKKNTTSQWILGWYSGNSEDRAYFAFHQKDNTGWPLEALLTGIKNWIEGSK